MTRAQRYPQSLGSICFLLGVVTCTSPTRSESEDRVAIDALRRDHMEAVNGRDAVRLLAGMTADIVYLAPDLPPTLGVESLGAVVRPAYEQFQPRITMTPRNVVVEEEWAFEWGCVGGELQPLAGGEPTPADGKYLFVYRWTETTGWKIAWDMYNPGPCLTAEGGGTGGT